MDISYQYYSVLKRFFTYFRIPLSVVNAQGETLYCFPQTEMGYIVPKNIIHEELDRYEEHYLDLYTPLMRNTPYNSMIAILGLPDANYLFVGPCFSLPFSADKANQIISDIYPIPELMKLQLITSKLPIVDEYYIADALSLLVLTVHYKDLPAEDIIQANHLIHFDRTVLQTNNMIEKEYGTLLQFELQIQYCIEHGKTENLERVWESFSVSIKENFQEYLYTELHFMIPLISSARQAALRSGAPQEEVLSIFHSAISHISSRGSMSVNLRTIERATYDMCNLVKKNKTMPFRSDVCLKCERYIDEHLTDKITATLLAEYCGVDRSLIFDIFRRNYNISLTEYIQQEKMRRAKMLLAHSTYPVSEIASILGYCSSSYFSKVFSKYCGSTPADFRNSEK